MTSKERMNELSEEDKLAVKFICAHFNITNNDLIGKSRKLPIPWARSSIAYYLRHKSSNKNKHTLVVIGKLLGGKHHSSVIHYLEVLTHVLAQVQPLFWKNLQEGLFVDIPKFKMPEPLKEEGLPLSLY